LGLLSNFSILLALPAFAALFAAAAVAAHSLLRLVLPPPERLSENHEVAGFIMGVVGVLYSVVLGFLVGTVWTAFASAQQTMDLEAGYVGDAFGFASLIDAPQKRELERLIARYALDVRNAPSPAGSTAEQTRTGALLRQAVGVTLSLTARKGASSAAILQLDGIRSELLDTLRKLADARRLRIVQSQSRLPQGMLEALILGAALVTAFSLLFGVKSYAKQMAMTALLAGSIGLFFGLVIEMSTPYSGAIQVSRASFNVVIDNNHLADFAK